MVAEGVCRPDVLGLFWQFLLSLRFLLLSSLQLWWSPYERRTTWAQNPEFSSPFMCILLLGRGPRWKMCMSFHNTPAFHLPFQLEHMYVASTVRENTLTKSLIITGLPPIPVSTLQLLSILAADQVPILYPMAITPARSQS